MGHKKSLKISTILFTLGVFIPCLLLSLVGAKKVTQITKLTSSNTNNIFPKDHQAFRDSEQLNEKFNDFKSSFKTVMTLSLRADESALDKTMIDRTEGFMGLLETKNFTDIKSYTNLEFAFEKNDELNFGKLGEIEINSAIKKSIAENQLFVPKLINSNLKEVHIYSTAPDSFTLGQVNQLKSLAQEQNLILSHISSKNLLAQQIQKELGSEIKSNVLLSYLVLCLICLFLYSSLGAIVFHSLLFVSSLLVSLSLVDIFGLKLNSLSVSLPIILLIIQISLGSHILSQLQQRSLKKIMGQNWFSISIALGSTLIGFSSLYLSSSPYLKEYSLVMSIAIIVAGYNFSAILLMLNTFTKLSFKKKTFSLKNPLTEWIASNTKQAQSNKYLYTLCSLMIILGVASKAYWNKSGAPNRLMSESSEVSKANDYYKSTVFGAKTSYLEVEGTKEAFWDQPKNLAKLDKLITRYMQNDAEALSIVSYIDVVKLFTSDAKIPSSDEALSEISFLMGMMGVETSSWASTSKKSLRLEFNSTTRDHKTFTGQLDNFESLLSNNFPQLKLRSFGGSLDKQIISRELAESLYWGFAVTFLSVLAILSLYWRDRFLVASVVLPNLIPIACVNLLLFVSQYSFDPSLAIIFSIVVGVSFDNSVFMVESWRRKPQLSAEANTSTQAISDIKSNFKLSEIFQSNFSILLCFSVFLFSTNEINLKFGILMCFAIVMAYIADSIVLPRILAQRDRKQSMEHESASILPLRKDISTYEQAS